MRAGLVVSGALGLGIAVVFGLAAITSLLLPNGTMIPASWNGGGIMFDKGFNGGVAVPMPAPPVNGPAGAVDKGDGTMTVTTVDDGATPLK